MKKEVYLTTFELLVRLVLVLLVGINEQNKRVGSNKNTKAIIFVKNFIDLFFFIIITSFLLLYIYIF